MIVDSNFLAGVRTLFQATFDQVMGAEPTDWTKFVTVIDTDGKTKLTFNWLGAPPMMRPMGDTLIFGKAFPHDYTITVTENGVGIEVNEQTFMNDPLGTITLFVKNLMRQAAKYEMKIAAETLSDGFTLLSFDGLAFYKATHTYGDSATHDNLDSAVLAADGVAYQTGWQTVNSAEDDAGEPMGLVPDLLVAHSNNRTVVKRLLNAEFTVITAGDGATSNVNKGDAEYIITPFLKTTTEWHLLATQSMDPKPVIFAEQMPKRFVPQDGLDSESAFTKNTYRYKVDNKIATGYGDPRSAYGSTGA
jgi:phage major head subunit gpT-like protein